jgi:hypothetical protein
MSVIIDRPSPDAQPADTWAVADEGLWVLTTQHSFGGTVDQHGAHFFAMDAFGRYVGDFDTLATAQDRLTHHVAAVGLGA